MSNADSRSKMWLAGCIRWLAGRLEHGARTCVAAETVSQDGNEECKASHLRHKPGLPTFKRGERSL